MDDRDAGGEMPGADGGDDPCCLGSGGGWSRWMARQVGGVHRVAHSFHLAPLSHSFRLTSEDPTPSPHRSFRLTNEGPLFRRGSRSLGAILGLPETPELFATGEDDEPAAPAAPAESFPPSPSPFPAPPPPAPAPRAERPAAPPPPPGPCPGGVALVHLVADPPSGVGGLTQIVMTINYSALLLVLMASIVHIFWSIEPILMMVDAMV